MQLAQNVLDRQGGGELVLRYFSGARGPLRVQVVQDGLGYDCNSGQAGDSREVPILGDTATCYAPPLPSASPATLRVRDADDNLTTLPLVVSANLFDTGTMQLASCFPPDVLVPARKPEDVPLPAPDGQTPDPMQAIIASFGYALTLLYGVRQTRLTDGCVVGDTTLAVEAGGQMPDAGTVRIDNVQYRYQARLADADGANNILAGVTYDIGGTPVPGAAARHVAGAPVTILDPRFNEYDRLLNTMFLDTAEGEDLAILGRMLGVPPSITLSGDDQYRALIGALAYKPAGTIETLRNTLDLTVGKGDYQLSEDPTAPGSVTITVPTEGKPSRSYLGRAFLSPRRRAALAQDNSLAFPDHKAFGAAGFLLAPEDAFFDVAGGNLSALTEAGATFWALTGGGQEFRRSGGDGAATCGLSSGKGAWVSARDLRATPTTTGRVSAVLGVAGTTLPTADGRATGLWLADGERLAQVGFTAGQSGQSLLGLRDASGALVPSGVSLANGTLHQVDLVLTATSVQLVVDRAVVATALRSSLPSSSLRQVGLGARVGTGGTLLVRSVALDLTDRRDYGVATGTDAQAAASADGQQVVGGTTLASQRVTIPSLTWAASDLGKVLVLGGGAGIGGRWIVARIVSPTVAEVRGRVFKAVGTLAYDGARNLLTVSQSAAFRFPEDVGKQVVVDDNSGGNAGVFTISDVLEDGTGLSLGGLRQRLNVAASTVVLAGSRLNPQRGMAFRVMPNFAAGASGLRWQLSAQVLASTPDQPAKVQARQGPPIAGALYDTTIDTNQSAMLLDAASDTATFRLGPPVQGSVYPFYLQSPNAALEAYTGGLLVQGSGATVVYG